MRLEGFVLHEGTVFARRLWHCRIGRLWTWEAYLKTPRPRAGEAVVAAEGLASELVRPSALARH